MDIFKLSTEQLAGQKLMVGFDGSELNPELKFYIDTLKIGGIILFSRNIFSVKQLEDLCASAQDHAASCGQPPLFIAIDQEGGVVARLKPPFTQFPGNSKMRTIGDAIEFAKTTSRELNRVGINMNMAPVMDVAPEGTSSIMSERSFGSDPEWVSALGITVIEHLQKGGVMAVAKHFPGIGRTTLDSHLDLPLSDTTFTELKNFDLPPFEAAIQKNVSGVMLSHIKYEKIDNVWPASLSTVIAKDMLRNELGFPGIVITDDLDMGAIEKHFDIKTSIDKIFEADIDIALICHPGPKISEAFEVFKTKLKSSENSRKKGVASVQRILDMKTLFNI